MRYLFIFDITYGTPKHRAYTLLFRINFFNDMNFGRHRSPFSSGCASGRMVENENENENEKWRFAILIAKPASKTGQTGFSCIVRTLVGCQEGRRLVYPDITGRTTDLCFLSRVEQTLGGDQLRSHSVKWSVSDGKTYYGLHGCQA